MEGQFPDDTEGPQPPTVSWPPCNKLSCWGLSAESGGRSVNCVWSDSFPLLSTSTLEMSPTAPSPSYAVKHSWLVPEQNMPWEGPLWSKSPQSPSLGLGTPHLRSPERVLPGPHCRSVPLIEALMVPYPSQAQRKIQLYPKARGI